MSAQARLCLAGGLRLAGGGLRVRSVQRWGACVPPPAPAVRGSPTVAVGVTSAAATDTYPSVWRPVFRRLVQLSSASITRTMGADQKRSHGGHSHGHGHHHHHHDNTYLTSSNKNDAGVRITRIGLFSNLGMAFAKGAGGYAFGSQALIADAWHSLTDLASDVLTLATVSWSLKPPTDAFPAGFGKPADPARPLLPRPCRRRRRHCPHAPRPQPRRPRPRPRPCRAQSARRVAGRRHRGHQGVALPRK
ncbi:hypothetical protein VDGD_21434 [Verticillium dahliae]|nr:hypothetical protein VDGD_21434 [Verticillium dahliae]